MTRTSGPPSPPQPLIPPPQLLVPPPQPLVPPPVPEFQDPNSPFYMHGEKGDLTRISDLWEEIYAMKQGTSSVTEFHTRFKVVWDELLACTPILSCRCTPRCSCGMAARLRDYQLAQQVMQFLRGLNESFKPLRSQILMASPLPPLNEVFSLVYQHEQEMAHPGSLATVPAANAVSSTPSQADLLAMAARFVQTAGATGNSGKQSNQQRRRHICPHCGGKGHTIGGGVNAVVSDTETGDGDDSQKLLPSTSSSAPLSPATPPPSSSAPPSPSSSLFTHPSILSSSPKQESAQAKSEECSVLFEGEPLDLKKEFVSGGLLPDFYDANENRIVSTSTEKLNSFLKHVEENKSLNREGLGYRRIGELIDQGEEAEEAQSFKEGDESSSILKDEAKIFFVSGGLLSVSETTPIHSDHNVEDYISSLLARRSVNREGLGYRTERREREKEEDTKERPASKGHVGKTIPGFVCGGFLVNTQEEKVDTCLDNSDHKAEDYINYLLAGRSIDREGLGYGKERSEREKKVETEEASNSSMKQVEKTIPGFVSGGFLTNTQEESLDDCLDNSDHKVVDHFNCLLAGRSVNREGLGYGKKSRESEKKVETEEESTTTALKEQEGKGLL
ncbi:unnamed protein product [Linum trigynum]|uniref:Retrotransposon gag domain-containing protein n=1 Tax=Linum trigynum TaxID=586398 RepID=A0AAV2FI85_9ROSI